MYCRSNIYKINKKIYVATYYYIIEYIHVGLPSPSLLAVLVPSSSSFFPIHVYILPGPGNYSQHTSNLLFNKTSTPGTVLYTLINTLRVRS